MDLRIILPTYNEKDNLKILIPHIFEVFKKNELNGDILIIDDNSQDGTAELAREMSKEYSIKIIQRRGKFGLGSAYVTGFRESLKDGKDIIFEMDADLSHDPEYIPEFIKKLKDGFDLVIGRRKSVVGWGTYRKVISWGGNFTGRILAGIKIKDLTTGYRAYRREVLKTINLDSIKSSGYAFQLEILARTLSKGFKVGSVPIVFNDRENGKSKLSKKDIIEFFIIALKIRMGLINV